jgi:RNA polymerase sigma factor (sigma-70 family)
MAPVSDPPPARPPRPSRPQPPPGSPPGTVPGVVDALASVRRYLRFLGCPADELGDLAHDALLAGLARWRPEELPVPWLLATARNLLRQHLRARSRRRELADVERLERAWCEQGGDDAARDLARAVAECVALLPPRSRAVLAMRYGEGVERDVIAGRVGLSAEGVKSLLVRARAAVAECVRRRHGDG